MADRIIRADGSLGGPGDMHPPAELQTPLHTSIADELIMITPQHWSEIRLLLVRDQGAPQDDLGNAVLTHTLSSPDGQEVVTPSDVLFERTRALELLFRKQGRTWRTVEYVVTVEEDNWSWRVAFTYDQP
jgi:hypothetical protein